MRSYDRIRLVVSHSLVLSLTCIKNSWSALLTFLLLAGIPCRYASDSGGWALIFLWDSMSCLMMGTHSWPRYYYTVIIQWTLFIYSTHLQYETFGTYHFYDLCYILSVVLVLHFVSLCNFVLDRCYLDEVSLENETLCLNEITCLNKG